MLSFVVVRIAEARKYSGWNGDDVTILETVGCSYQDGAGRVNFDVALHIQSEVVLNDGFLSARNLSFRRLPPIDQVGES